MARATEEVLGTKNMGLLVLQMAIPAILAQLVNLLYNIVDRIYIGNMDVIGKDALGGIGLTTPIIILIAAFSCFVSGGGAPLASRSLGEGNKARATKILSNGLTILIIFSIVLGLLAYFLRKPVLYAIGASDVTYSYANDYLSIYLIGTLFVQIATGLNPFISGQGKSKTAMASVLIGAFLNIALDPLFIFTFNMGVKGAAVATIISQFISCSFVLYILFNKNTSLRIQIKDMKLDKEIIKAVFLIGIAPFVMASTESIIGFALNGQLQRYGGDDYVSTLTILQSCMMIITVPISGFTQGVTPILAYNYGASFKARFRKCYLITIATCFLYCGLLALVMMIIPEPFARIFTQNEILICYVKTYLPVFISGMLIFGIQRACQTTFVATGLAKISLFIAILRKIILLVPLTFILPLFMGVSGVYHAECYADFLACITCGTIFFFKFSKIMKTMEKKEIIKVN